MKQLDQKLQQILLDETNDVEAAAQEYLCAMKRLDDLKIDRYHDDIELSLVGRINKASNTFEG